MTAPRNELEAAELVRDGELPSPYCFMNVTLFALRITGTGLAYRSGINEHVWRDPSLYLNAEFLGRCNGLPVIWEHPEKLALDSDAFGARTVGTIVLPYIKGEEIWGVAKIYDDAAAEAMADEQLSTSPAVVFKKTDGNQTIKGNETTLLIEGEPSLLDHLAVVSMGVWDKGRTPSGVRNDGLLAIGDSTMPGEDDKGGEKLDKLLEHLGDMSGRMDAGMGEMGKKFDSVSAMCDALNKRMDAMEGKKKADDDEVMEDADKARKDAAKAKKDAEDKQNEEELEELASRGDSVNFTGLSLRAKEDTANLLLQSRFDSVANLLGEKAPQPMSGERPRAYRVRLLRTMQRHSPSFKDTNLAIIDSSALGGIEAKIIADATAASAVIGNDSPILQMITKRDPATGRVMHEFRGDHTFISEMKRPSQRVLKMQVSNPYSGQNRAA